MEEAKPLEPVLVEWYDEHWYKVPGENGPVYIPSVTTKLGILDKPQLARWRGDVGNREADLRMYDASQRGKRIHWAWETALLGGAVIYDPWQNPVYPDLRVNEALRETYGEVAILRTQDEMSQIHKLQRWFKALSPKPVEIELRVVDLENFDAGTIDAVYDIRAGAYMVSGAKPLVLDGGLYIQDLKTGNYLDENVWLQLAAYGAMYEKAVGIKISGALVTHTGAKTKGGIRGLNTLVRDRETLLSRDYPDYRRASDLWLRNHKDDAPEEYQFPAVITLKEENA